MISVVPHEFAYIVLGDYAGHPVALQLRAMNIIYETTKERGATIQMPSSMALCVSAPTELRHALSIRPVDRHQSRASASANFRSTSMYWSSARS
jgi:hypothetical protein